MSAFGNSSKTCDVLDIINGKISREHSENCTDCIANIDEDVILPPVDGGQQAWTFMIGAFMIEGLMWGKNYIPYRNYSIDIRSQVSR
jgi:hypothetical protein